MNRAEFEKAQQAHLEQQRLERDKRRKDTWGRANAPGPPPITCCECGAVASFGIGDFGKPTDTPEHFCFRHWPRRTQGTQAPQS